MYLCKSKKHVWSSKEDAEKCCNGFKRITIVRKQGEENLPHGARMIRIDPETGMQVCRIWVPETTPELQF
ncbi:MAG: hypothetical protein D6732_05535 [Methanobacteriota archaeon]|nr:MAG: hypothetical protein D6732_05535 [Euryarchaeota archaeon]